MFFNFLKNINKNKKNKKKNIVCQKKKTNSINILIPKKLNNN